MFVFTDSLWLSAVHNSVMEYYVFLKKKSLHDKSIKLRQKSYCVFCVDIFGFVYNPRLYVEKSFLFSDILPKGLHPRRESGTILL